MSLGEYVEGAALFVVMLGGSLAGAWFFLVHRYPQLTGAARVAAYGLLAALGVLAVHVVPLALGVMDRATVIVATALWLAAAWFAPRVAAGPDPAPQPERESPPLASLLSALALAALGLMALIVLRDRLTVAPTGVDYLNFHMPSAISWLQSGSLWQIDVFLSDVAPGHYPNNGDVFMLAAILPWKSDFLASFVMYPFWALTGVSVYAAALEVRAPRATAAMAAALLMAVPAASISSLDGGFVDPVMVFGLAVGLLFLIRHHRTGNTSELVLAGLALGLSFGTKWYAVSAVPTVVGLWALGRLWARRRPIEFVRQTVAVSALVAAVGGIWLVRNMVESANPLFPVKVTAFGSTIFDAPVDRVRSRAGYTIANYLGDSHAWTKYILPQYRDSIATPAALLLLGALLAVLAVLLARRRSRASKAGVGEAVVGLAIAAILALAYIATPYTAGGPKGQPTLVGADARYLLPTLVVGAILAAWASGRFRRGPVVFGVVGLVAVLEGLHQLQQGLFLDFDRTNVGGALAVLLLAGAAALAVGPPLRELAGRPRIRALAVLTAVLVVVLAAGGRTVSKDYLAHRYFGIDAVADGLNTQARTGHRVGLAGVWSDEGLAAPLLAFGPRFGNHVAYVGRNDKDDLRRYRSGARFEAALRRGRYDWLVVGRGRPPKPSVNEERWAAASGFRVVVRSPRLTLLRRG